jgi:hypothetical protein
MPLANTTPAEQTRLVAENLNPYDGQPCGPGMKTYRARSGLARVKPSIEMLNRLEADDLGFCLHCGDSEQEIESDAEKATCEVCGQPTLYGVAELALRGLYF